MANGHGGRRPGAGRKKTDTVVAQEARRAAFESKVTQRDWEDIVERAVVMAKMGDKDARQWLSPWVVGKVPEEVNVNGTTSIEVVYSDRNSANPALPAQTSRRSESDRP